MIAVAIRSILLASPSVTDELATGPHGEAAVFVGATPQRAPSPRVEVHLLSTDPLKTLTNTTGLRSAVVDIDCKAYSWSDAAEVADAVESVLNDYTGVVGGVTIRASLLNDRAADVEAVDAGSDMRLYVATLDYQFQYEVQ